MRRIWILLLLSFVFISGDAFAQYHKGRMWTVSSGLVFPMSPDSFADRWKSGFNVSAGIHHCFDDTQRISVRAVLEYHRLSANRNDVLADSGIIDPTASLHVMNGAGSIWNVAFDLKISPRWTEGRFVPYLVGGPTLTRITQDVTFTEPPATQTQSFNQTDGDVSVGFGGGIDFILRPDVTVFLEAKYTMIFTQDVGPRYLPIRLGVIF